MDDNHPRLRDTDSVRDIDDASSIRWATPVYRLEDMQRSADRPYRLSGDPYAVSKSRPASYNEYRLHGKHQAEANTGTTNSIDVHRVPAGPPQYRLRGSVPVPMDKFPFPRSKLVPLTSWRLTRQAQQEPIDSLDATAQDQITSKVHRLSILTWNPGGPRKSKYATMCIKAMMEGKWHVILGQECQLLIDALDDRFHYHEWEGLLVAFNKNTFEADFDYEHSGHRREHSSSV